MIQPRFCFVILFIAALFLSGANAFAIQQTESIDRAADLTDASFAKWRELIRADESELGWQQLPWATSFYEGLRKAAEAEKPLLLWAMNGHPMGCT